MGVFFRSVLNIFSRLASDSLSTAAIFAVGIALGGCTFKTSKVGGSAAPFDFFKVESYPLSYSTIDAAIIGPSCVECHAPPSPKHGIDLSSYTALRLNLQSAYDEAVNFQQMPPLPRPLLNGCQAALLKAWMDAGAPQVGIQPVGVLPGCSPAELNPANPPAEPSPQPIPQPEPQPEPQPVPQPVPPTDLPLEMPATFDGYINNVYKPKCFSCHRAGGDAEDHHIDTIDDLVADGNVMPGQGEKSPLFTKVIKIGKGQMPPAKAVNIPRVTAAEADAIKRWIDAGARL